MVLFADLNEHDLGLIHAPIDDLEFLAGASMYDEGDAALGIFTLRTGMVKLVRVTSDGRNRIVLVPRPGNVVGPEALATKRYSSEAVALKEVSACRIPLEVIQRPSVSSNRMNLTLMQKWNLALKDADNWLADLNFGTATQRVVALVRKMRNLLDGMTCTLFSREDMGAMLNLKLETVSKEISKLAHEGIIEPADKASRIYFIRKPDLLLDR